MKIAVYTCIVGGYDSVKKHHISTDIDYLVYSDNKDIGKPLIENFSTPRLTNRFHKIMWHKIPELLNYDYTIYIDGNISIKTDINPFVEKYLNTEIGLFSHPIRKCIYVEGNACIKYHKAKEIEVKKQLDEYRLEGYPKNNGLIMGSIILRSKPTKESTLLCENWYNEVSSKVCRDQLSFNYCVWKNGLDYTKLDKTDLSVYFDIPKGFKHK